MKKSADKSSSKGCFSCILQRLLCARSLPTHPSDQLIDSNANQIVDEKAFQPLKTENKVLKQAPSSPSVVARLMGLDSFPETPLHPKNRTLGSFFRSRSVNSIDFCLVFDPSKQQPGHNLSQHRRVKTSVSFREGINDDYGLVFKLSDIDEGSEHQEQFIVDRRPIETNHQRGRKENRFSGNLQMNKGSGKNVEMEGRRRSVCVNSAASLRMGNKKTIVSCKAKEFHGEARKLKERRPMMKKMVKVPMDEPNFVMKKKNKEKTTLTLSHKVHSERSLRKVHPEISLSEIPSVENSEKVGPSKIVNCDNGEVKAAIKGRNERKLKNDESENYYKRMVSEICNLTAEDFNGNWVSGMELRKFVDFEEICQELGQDILEILLIQFLDELVH